MEVIYCVDNNLGISFNNRRVSSDKEIINDIYKDYDCINIFKRSEDLFREKKYNVIESIDNDVYFLEDNYNIFSSKLILYKFNRDYPSDVKLNYDLSKYKMISSYNFKGNSHDKITKEVYICDKN